MNSFEQKCALMAQTPQSRWWDLRFKPVIQMINNMLGNHEISGLVQIPSPVFQMMNIQALLFKYMGQYYVLFINKEGNVYNCFHIETPSGLQYSSMLASHIVLSSDDDTKQDTWIPSLALTLGVKSSQELVNKFKSILGE